VNGCSAASRARFSSTPTCRYSCCNEQHDDALYASVDAGFIGQNVYLYCASEGLGTVFRGAVDAHALGALMKLPEGQFVTFAQSVGYPRA
jgi:nitroreductase